jgi:hypothetical protein
MSQFYLTVSSDSGCHFQESNKISKFKVHLGRVIELSGDWEVALFEMFYPETFDNIRKGNCFILKENIGQLPNSDNILRVKSQTEIQNGFYHTHESLCTALNECTGDTLHFGVDADKNNKTIVYANNMAHANEKVIYEFSDTLVDILGFSRGLMIDDLNISEGIVPCDLRKGMPQSLKVYTDIIADQLINNTHSKLLRELHLNPDAFKFGFQQHKNFERLVFLPVIKKKLEFLEFLIKDEQENEVSFSHGTLKLILLFRRTGNGF